MFSLSWNKGQAICLVTFIFIFFCTVLRLTADVCSGSTAATDVFWERKDCYI